MTTAKLLGFYKDGDWYTFRVTTEGEDFARAIAALTTLRLSDCIYNADTKTWSLRAGPGAEQLLAEAFANGKQCVELAKVQW